MEEIKTLLLIVLFFFALFSHLHASEKNRQKILEDETKNILERCQRIATQFYVLEDWEDFKEITSLILESEETKESTKDLIRLTDRRFFLFKYPSGGFQVKGVISFLPHSGENQNPLLLFLRGGNRIFGLFHPASDFMCAKNYTVLASTYRGGVSEGKDEFGGAEVNDIQHLVDYFPTLQKKIGMSFFPSKTFMLGASRGGMEMFLALNRSPSIQQQVTKAVSLSGLLDLHACMVEREDMRSMFIKDFGLEPEQNEEEWVKSRNPLTNVGNLRKDLPILIVQGTEDLRTGLNEGYHMVKALEYNGNPVTYLEIPGGDHCLANQSDRVDIITTWLEQ